MARAETLPSGDTLDRICGELHVYQARRGYRFGLEALLLAGFVEGGARRLLDLGTGSGVLPLVLVHFGKAARAVGLELQPQLAERARRSVEWNQLAERIEVVEGDLCRSREILPPAAFDLVVANPPYGPHGVGARNPDREKAIARHEVCCTLADVVAAAAAHLEVRGRFCAVLPPARLSELLARAEEHHLRPARLRMVHPRLGLSAKHCLVEAVRGGRMSLGVLPPLVVFDTAGAYTPEVQAMLYPGGCNGPSK